MDLVGAAFGPLDGDGTVHVSFAGRLDGVAPDQARLARVGLARETGERTLEVSERVAAHAADVHRFLDACRQVIRQDAGARELMVPEGVLLRLAEDVFLVVLECLEESLAGDGGPEVALRIADAFADGDDAPAELLDRLADVGGELLDGERRLGQVDKMRPVAVLAACQHGRGGEPAGVAAHDDVHLDAGDAAVVEVVAADRAGDEPRGAAEARRVVVLHEVVVNRLRDVEDPQFVVLPRRRLVDEVGGQGRIVPADVEKVPDTVFLELFEQALAILGFGLVTDAAEGRPRRLRDRLQALRGHLEEVQKVVGEDPLDPVPRAQQGRNLLVAASLLDDAGEGLVDDGGRSARLSDARFAFEFCGHGLLLWAGFGFPVAGASIFSNRRRLSSILASPRREVLTVGRRRATMRLSVYALGDLT